MNLWNIQDLESALSRDEVSDRQSLFYYGASAIINLIFTQYSLWWGPRHGWLFISEFGVLLLLIVWGLISCWNASGGASSKHFILKIVCLSVPIGLRTNLLAIAIGLGVYVFRQKLFGSGTFKDPSRPYDFISYGIFVSMAILYWKMLAESMRRANGRGENERET